MAETQQDLGKKPVDLLQGPVRKPEEVPSTVSNAEEDELVDRELTQWLINEVMTTGKTVHVLADYDSKTITPILEYGL